jgi:predicted ATPase
MTPETAGVAGIIGRDRELAAGAAFLTRLQTGPAALAIEGEAGVGKSTVWSAIAAQARGRGWTVLVARPAEPEARLTLAAIADLIEGVEVGRLESLPEPQRRALHAALFLEEPARDYLAPRLLGTAVRSVLTGFATTRPVVVAIDDVQWVDATSAYGADALAAMLTTPPPVDETADGRMPSPAGQRGTAASSMPSAETRSG